MIKHEIQSVANNAKGTGHVVWVKIFDDQKPEVILSKIPIPFTTQEEFEYTLARKTKKYTDAQITKEDVRVLAQASIVKIESKDYVFEEKNPEPKPIKLEGTKT